MPKPHAKPTTAANLEAKFDAGEDVLDYFDLSTAKIAAPMKRPVAKTANRTATVPAGIGKKALKIAVQIRKLETELSSLIGKRNVKPASFVLPHTP
ncbi:MAG: hypothetical protein ABIP20_01670 [Chthoniobacteraceae bacterium]